MPLNTLVPDVDVLLAMAPEELAGILINLLIPKDKTTLGGLIGELYVSESFVYPREKEDAVRQALEADKI